MGAKLLLCAQNQTSNCIFAMISSFFPKINGCQNTCPQNWRVPVTRGTRANGAPVVYNKVKQSHIQKHVQISFYDIEIIRFSDQCTNIDWWTGALFILHSLKFNTNFRAAMHGYAYPNWTLHWIGSIFILFQMMVHFLFFSVCVVR